MAFWPRCVAGGVRWEREEEAPGGWRNKKIERAREGEREGGVLGREREREGEWEREKHREMTFHICKRQVEWDNLMTEIETVLFYANQCEYFKCCICAFNSVLICFALNFDFFVFCCDYFWFFFLFIFSCFFCCCYSVSIDSFLSLCYFVTRFIVWTGAKCCHYNSGASNQSADIVQR